MTRKKFQPRSYLDHTLRPKSAADYRLPESTGVWYVPEAYEGSEDARSAELQGLGCWLMEGPPLLTLQQGPTKVYISGELDEKICLQGQRSVELDRTLTRAPRLLLRLPTDAGFLSMLIRPMKQSTRIIRTPSNEILSPFEHVFRSRAFLPTLSVIVSALAETSDYRHWFFAMEVYRLDKTQAEIVKTRAILD